MTIKNVPIREDVHAILKKYCKKEGMKIQFVATEAVRIYLANLEVK